jgi:SRSO17 transposase
VDLGELARVRVELQDFCVEAFASLRRRDQRYWGSVYLRGLMLDGERKSVEPISLRLPEADRQSLQQFLADSPWDPVPVRAAMARTMAKVIDPQAVAARRTRCKIPEQVRHAEKWRLALDSLDELHAWGVRVPLALADAGYGDCFEFRLGLQERGLSYVVGVTSTMTAQPADAHRVQQPYAGRGPRTGPAYPDKPLALAALAAEAGAGVARAVSWREGSKAKNGPNGPGARMRPCSTGSRICHPAPH